MLPFALPSDEPRDLPLARQSHELQRSLRSMVKLYVGQPQRTDLQQDAFSRDLLAGLPELDEAAILDIATEICPCPDIPFTLAMGLMERSDAAVLMIHAEAVFLHENYLLATARRGDPQIGAAIAMRPALSHGILVELVARDEPIIDAALADNHALVLPREIRRILQMRGRFDASIAMPLLRRRDIQPLERLPLFMRADAFARMRLINECAPLLAPALRPAEADRDMTARMAAFQEASLGRFGPLAEFLGLDPVFIEILCQDGSGEPLALMCAAAELRGFDTLSVLAHWPTQPARQAGRLSALSDIATGLLPGIALALLIRIGG